jgi:hypothetical protein
MPASRFIVNYGRPAESRPSSCTGHDRRVVEPRLNLRLAPEPRDRIRRQLAAHPLDRGRPPDPQIRGEQDLAHAAAPEDLAQLVPGPVPRAPASGRRARRSAS